MLKFAHNKTAQSMTRIAQELNINDIKKKNKNANDNLLNLSDGTALLLAFNKNIYESNDDYVSKTPYRQQIAQNLQTKFLGSKINYVETSGVAEAGSGFFATIPVFRTATSSVGFGFGFSVGIILRYRTAQPVISTYKRAKNFVLPLSLEEARQMTVGQEFEICGQAKVRGDISFAARYGAQAGLAAAGIQTGVSSSAAAAAEYSLCIIKLEENKIRVIIRKLDRESVSISSNTFLGLILPSNAIWRGNWGVPQAGHGLLKYLVEHKGNSSFEGYLNDYTTLSCALSMDSIHKGTHICTYDLDLLSNQAEKIYDNLIRFDFNFLADKNIPKIDLYENQYMAKRGVRIALCAEKLFLIEALKSRSCGELLDNNNSNKIYRDRSYKKHKENWLTSNSDALWEVVEIKKDQEEAKTYYHFNYKKNDYFTRQAEIDKFFNFASALDIKKDGDSTDNLVAMKGIKKIFSTADDTKLDIDLYFTVLGVERIRASSQEQRIEAFLKTYAELDLRFTKHPCLDPNNIYTEPNQIILGRYKKISFNLELKKNINYLIIVA